MRNIQPRVGVRKLQRMMLKSEYGLPVEISRDRLFKLLGDNDLLVKRKKRYHQTTNSRHSLPSYPNLLKELDVRHVNQVWVSDITYVKLPQGKFCYLFLITDYFSRKIIGYALKSTLSSDGAIEVLKKALKNAKPSSGFIHHSDHGVQYCNKAYTALLHKHKAQISMTGVNHCYDNAVAERVNGILKQEFGLGSTIASFEAAHKLTRQAIYLYNSVRLHTSHGYHTPDAVFHDKALPENSNVRRVIPTRMFSSQNQQGETDAPRSAI